MNLSTFCVLLMYLILLQSEVEPGFLEECLLGFVEKYKGKHVLYMAESDSYELEILLKMEEPRYFYSKYHFYLKSPSSHIDLVLILSQNSKIIDGFLYSIKNFSFKNSVLLVFISLEKQRGVPQSLLRIAWKYGFRNALVVQRHDLKVYSYLPVLSGYCTNVKLISLGDCSNLNYQMYDSNVDITNCTMGIGVNTVEPYFDGSSGGFEAAILKIVIEKIGLHVEYTMIDYNVLSEMLDDCSLDLLAGEMIPDGDLSRYVVYYSENEMALFVPIAKTLPPWKSIVHVYELETWIGLLASIAALTIFWHVAHRNNQISILYIVFSPISPLPHTPTTFKPLFALWMLLPVILTNSFSGLLISFMFKPLYDRQMSSLNNLIAENWRIYDSTFYPYFINDTNLDFLGDRHSFCSDCYHYLFHDKAAYASTIRSFNYIAKSNKNLEVYKFNSLKLYLVFYVCSRSRYQTKIQHVASRMFEVGLVSHLDTYNYDPPKTIWHKHYMPVALQHLYLIICVHFAGLFVASLAFFQELRKLGLK